MNKKYAKIKLILWSVTALLLICVLIIGISNKGNYFGFLNGNNNVSGKIFSVKEHSIDTKNTDTLSVNLYCSDILIKESSDNNIKIVERSNKKSMKEDPIEISKNNNEIEIYSKKTKGKMNFSIGMGFGKTTEIYLPKNLKSNIKIKNNIGDLSVDTDIVTNQFTVEMDKGDIDIRNVKTDKYDIKSSVGDIKIESIYGSGKVNSSVGDIKCGLKNAKGTVDIVSDTGDVEVYLLDDLGFKLNAKWEVGDFDSNLDFDKVNFDDIEDDKIKTTVGKSPYYNLNISSDVGDLNLKRK